ncbi:MAG: GNAT family N-acetyltransferase [Muribaculaceae bacterium]|nr:GNAT family N-acetyltransferase [Muribaculaceae bacterium]
MDSEELKRKLLGLWEKTTHGPKEFLGVLFDYYFNTDYIEYEELDGKVVSALCGIPYNFGYGSNKLKGLYIIPLSAEEGFRKKGVLSDLLRKFNEKMKEDFDFTFLVPSNELLANYFGTEGYFSTFFMHEERYTPLHDFRNDYLLWLNESDERIRQLKIGLMDDLRTEEFSGDSVVKQEIIDFIEKSEKNTQASVSLSHTSKDLDYLLNQSFPQKLNIFVAKDPEGSVAGVAFCHKEELKRIRVEAIYVEDKAAYYSLLDFIKQSFPDHSISVNATDSKNLTLSLVQYTYASENPSGGDLDNTFGNIEIPFNVNKLLQPKGMATLLKLDRIIEFIAATRSDVDFRLHIRDNDAIRDNVTGDSGELKGEVLSVKNGHFSREMVAYPIKDKSILNLTQKEVTELLLRKNDSSNLIMEAFGIPRLNLQMRLLPC